MRGIVLVPDRLALPITRRLCFLFHPLCALLLLWGSAVCHGLVYLDFLSGTPAGLFSSIPPSACLTGYLLLLFSVLFHEFGHLSACTYFHCPHGEIRLGLYLVFPVFYANVSPAWCLNRRARVIVDLGGMYFQLICTIPASILSLHTRNPVWLLLLLQLDAMILFSLNPFLRFDGYWLCSDLLGVPNLRTRSQVLINGLWSRLIGRDLPQEAPLLRIRPAARLGLTLYAIGSYGFGVVAFVLLSRVLPARIQALPFEFSRLLEGAIRDGLQGDLPGALFGLVHLVFMGLLVLAGGRMLLRAARAASRTGRTLVWKIADFQRRDFPHG